MSTAMRYVCGECGHVTMTRTGRCPACGADFVRLPSKKKDYGADDELCEKVKRLRERAKKII